MASSYRQNTSENCSIYRIKVVLMTRTKLIPLDLQWLPNNAMLYCRSITLHQPQPLHCLTFNPKSTEIWWVSTVLQKHTTSTSGGLLNIKAVWCSNALITIYQAAWCPKPGNFMWTFTTVKTWRKECKNINYQGWMFHYEKKELQVQYYVLKQPL